MGDDIPQIGDVVYAEGDWEVFIDTDGLRSIRQKERPMPHVDTPEVPDGWEPPSMQPRTSTRTFPGKWSPKTLGEWLREQQTWAPDDFTRAEIGRLIDVLDLHRPLGRNGKHGNLHTPTCGCEDGPTRLAWRDVDGRPTLTWDE